jgi:hypothetical protein
MKFLVASGSYILAIVLGLLGVLSLRKFRTTGTKCDLFFALAFFGGTIYLPIDRLAASTRVGSILLLLVQVLVGISIALGTASTFTVDSGILQATRKGVGLTDWLLGRVSEQPTPTPPTTSRWTGILIGVTFVAFGIILHLLLARPRPFYVLVTVGIGLATIVLSALTLRK